MVDMSLNKETKLNRTKSAAAVKTTAYPQRGKTTSNECPGYDTKQSDSEDP